MSMKLAKKGEAPKSDDAEALAAVPAMPWDHAMKMLGTGDYDLVGFPRDGRGPDLPADQSPAPGVDPVDGRETQVEGSPLSNMVLPVTGAANGGLPREPEPVKSVTAKAPTVAQSPKADDKKA